MWLWCDSVMFYILISVLTITEQGVKASCLKDNLRTDPFRSPFYPCVLGAALWSNDLQVKEAENLDFS